MRKDFQNAYYKKLTNAPKVAHPKDTRRIVELNLNSDYFKAKGLFVGKLVRIISETQTGGKWIEFVNEDDRKAVNAKFGWSDGKRQYLIYGVKFDE